MITLRLELLGGAYHAADHTLTTPEWPPHPDRVFQALTATMHALGNLKEHHDVLESIEGVPWLITASDAISRPAMLHYVPRNEDQGGGRGTYNPAMATARTKERRLPVCHPDDPVLYFHFDANCDTVSLDALARGVSRLGRTPVILSVVENTVSPTWEPIQVGQAGAELALRIPYPGRLSDLEAAFGNKMRAGVRWASYRRVAKVKSRQFDRGEFSSLAILAASGRGVDSLRTALLMDAARRALLATCQDPLPTWLSGHHPDGSPLRDAHLGILPAVFAGQHGDGRIMGIALAIPGDVEESEARQSLRSILLDGLYLADQHWGPANSRSVTTEVATWTRPATSWTTVTPMEVRRRDRRPALEIAAEWAERAGLPAPIHARLRPEPFEKGPHHASRYADGKRPRYRVHALVEWDEPIQGPVAMGMGRYRGFGLMRPM